MNRLFTYLILLTYFVSTPADARCPRWLAQLIRTGGSEEKLTRIADVSPIESHLTDTMKDAVRLAEINVIPDYKERRKEKDKYYDFQPKKWNWKGFAALGA